MSKLDRINTFIKVIDYHSFNAAAKQLNISPAAVSRQISALEKTLGSQLLRRNTRHLWVTDTGKYYYDECKKTLQQLNDIEGCIAQRQLEPTGRLRVTSSRYYATTYILPHLAEFCTRFPKIDLHLELAERFPDLMQEDIDVLFGISMEGPPDLVRRRVMTTQYVLCASPAYLKKHGSPQTPQDLLKHRYITHCMRKPLDEVFLKNGNLKVKPTLWLNDAKAMQIAATSGLGIVMLHEYAIAKELREKKLIEVLKEHRKSPQSVYLYYLKSCYLQLKIRSFIDFYLSKIQK
jgi:DNA-binding transcriptional LysR family regulator